MTENNTDFKKGQCKSCQQENKKWFCNDCPASKEARKALNL